MTIATSVDSSSGGGFHRAAGGGDYIGAHQPSDAQDANRDIDVKDPAPVEIGDDEAADRRA